MNVWDRLALARRIYASFFLLLCGYSCQLSAAPETAVPVVLPVATTQTLPSRGLGADYSQLIEVFGLLLLVIVLILASAWIANRLGMGRMMGRGQIALLSSMPLGPREKLMLVEVKGQQLLLGVTAQNIRLLQSWPQMPQQDAAEEEVDTIEASSFGERFRTALRQQGGMF